MNKYQNKNFICLFLISLGLIFTNCSGIEKPKIDPSEVIVEAVNLNYDDLSETEKEEMIFTNCCCYPENWNYGINCVERENAFYVKAKINVDLLASLSESETFQKEDLVNSNPHSLYGKYHNRWKFLDKNGQEICPTAKFDGHNDFGLKRIDKHDILIIGPLPEKPEIMIIEILESKYYKGLNPEKVITESSSKLIN